MRSPRTPARPSSRSRIDIDRDYILRGDEAVAYGLVDEILTKQEQLPVEALR